jgi:hypothetical protein
MCYKPNPYKTNLLMKKIIPVILVALISSCAVPAYYQMYNVKYESGKLNNDQIVFEDANCIISYYLWSQGGSIGFTIFNKTENDIRIDLRKTFFVLNGYAIEYFHDRTYSKSSNSIYSSSAYLFPNSTNNSVSKISSSTSSNSYGIEYKERPEMTIPPKTRINITDYKIVESRYINCDLAKSPSRRNIKTISFNKDNSPFVFYNLITYITKNDTIRLENNFYVSDITNLPESEVMIKVDKTPCGTPIFPPLNVIKDERADRFYFKYND